MPATLMDAIEAYWKSAGLDSSVGPFFPLTVDPGTPAPYARGLEMPGGLMRDSSKTYVEESHVQISVFAPDEVADDLAQTAEAALDAIEDDNSLLTFDSGELIYWGRSGPPPTMADPGFSKAGDTLGHAMLNYRALVQRTRA
jgi:hypothetical protein